MSRKYVMRDLEKEYDDLNEVIPKLVNQGGQKYAAHQLNVAVITISRWLKNNGYIQKIEWIKKDKERAF